MFGHRISDFRPDGYSLCDRCNCTDHPAYEYEGDNAKFHKDAILLMPFRMIRFQWNLFKAWVRRGFHKNELPF